MKKINQIRFHQGDVQGKGINSIPSNAKRIENSPLAYGEITGHVHVLTGDVEMYELEGKRYAKVGEKQARLQHVLEGNLTTPNCMAEVTELPIADHKSILLAPGIYEFGIQKEFNPFEKIFEKVRD